MNQQHDNKNRHMMSPVQQTRNLMYTIMRSIAFCMVMMGMTVAGYAQQALDSNAAQTVQMADGLRQSGKIYVVVAVLLTILLGLFLYLLRLDSKISKLEKN